MATHTTAPPPPGGTTPPVEPPVAPPPPPPPKPLDVPLVYYNTRYIEPPKLAFTDQDQAKFDADPDWTTVPPQKAAAEEKWPQLYYDVNDPPQIMGSKEDVKKLDESRWRKFPMTQGLVDAAQANIKAQEAAAQAKQGTPAHGGTQAHHQ